jgi:hypothetical protein
MAIWSTVLGSVLVGLAQGADETVIAVDAGRVIHRVSPLLYGACIEDVNHEIYGGLYSQMIFGESFQEPPRPVPPRGFAAYGGAWSTREGVLEARPGDGPKLISEEPAFADGEASVEVRFPADQAGNAGLIVRVGQPAAGADAFVGYEVSLETSGHLVLGRHRRNWEPLRRVPCSVPVDRWIALEVRMKGASLEIRVDGRRELTFEDAEHPLPPGGVGLRTWRRPASFRNFRVEAGDSARGLAFEPRDRDASERAISGMWGPVLVGSARGRFEIEPDGLYPGRQAQRLTFLEGEGAIGVENRGLNRRGLSIVAGKPYEGYLWARSEGPARLTLALEDAAGGRRLARSVVEVKAGDWTRYEFAMTPEGADPSGRFAIALEGVGSVVLGHAFLQPGEWGRFRGLPVRKDVAEALIDQGIAVLRYGGSMINHPTYRWKGMIGPRDRRPPHAGTWYPHSTDGWGILDFLNFCEAAGFLAIPAVNAGESPADMADFIEYVNGPADSPWGRRRVADGHPAPYGLKHLEIGNEEAVNEDYWAKFRPIAEAIWARDPGIVLVVGDFAYSKVIEDPYRFEGGAAVKTLAAHRKILELARERGREVWFDIHVWTDHPPEPHGLRAERSYIEQLGRLAPGANYKVAFFEYNAGNHAMKRALSNALATIEAERLGDLLPVACAANCLQPDGQNDNGWDQGLLFLDPSRTWLQPPGYLSRMNRRHFQPLLVHAEARGRAEKLSVNAKRAEDGKALVLQVVNWGDEPRPARILVEGFSPSRPSATVEQLAGPLEGTNTADEPERIRPRRSEWMHELGGGGKSTYSFPPRSITILRLE